MVTKEDVGHIANPRNLRRVQNLKSYRIQRSKDDIANLIDDAHLEGYENKI